MFSSKCKAIEREGSNALSPVIFQNTRLLRSFQDTVKPGKVVQLGDQYFVRFRQAFALDMYPL